ncbi:MAG TPA: choice-of-anchor B family protein [Anaerolineales bacterium]|nr:choice-of-anchor B family protein [Anaerolineales bacterium]
MKSLSRNQWLVGFILFCLSLMVVSNILIRQPVFAQSGSDTPEPPRVDEDAVARQAFMASEAADMADSYRSLAPETFTPCENGFAGSYACDKVDLMAFMPLSNFTSSSSNDVQGWTDPLDGTEYAVLGLNNGTAFIDISDPENPVYLGKLPTHTGSSLWREIEVMGNYAYVVADNDGAHGLQIFDLTQLRNVVNPPVTFTETEHYNQFANGHTVGGNAATNFMYIMGSNTCSGGLHMVNVADPLNPTNAGCYSGDGYSHDAQCVLYHGPDTTYQNHEICFNSNEDSMTIVDVTNKASPVMLSRNTYAGSSYTHSTWITDDHTYVLLDDEIDETSFGHNSWTRIWDVSDLNAPTIINIYEGPYASIDHNIYIHNGLAYLANYTAGLQILDLADVANGNLTRLAYFDSYTPNDAAEYEGAWAVFPYFDSGLVLITGIGEGMYIVKPRLQATFDLETKASDLVVCTPGEASGLFNLTAQNNYTGTVTLSTSNLPAGSLANFVPNPVEVPNTSTMTVTVSTTPAGTYPFTVIGTDDTLTQTVDLSLTVYDAMPGTPTLVSPTDGEIDVEVPITFSWQASSQAVTYVFEIATDAAFTDVVYTAEVADTSHIAAYGFTELTTYYWRVQAINPCGTGAVSEIFSFTTQPLPSVLLVDDDDNSPNVRSYYTAALDALGVDYNVWDTENSDNEPSAADIAPYEIVIWFTGDEFGGAAGPSAGSEAILGSWLDSYSGCLMLSSQDYFYDRGLTDFMETYLGAASVTNDNGNYSYAIGHDVFEPMGTRVLLYPFADQADVVTPDVSAILGVVGNNGNGAALLKDSGTYKTTFWAFPFESIYSANNRRTAMELFLNWCGGGEPTPTPTPTLTPTVTPPPSETYFFYMPVVKH